MLETFVDKKKELHPDMLAEENQIFELFSLIAT